MRADEFVAKYGVRLAQIFGSDYRDHPAYPDILRQVENGKRTVLNILADYTEKDGKSPSDMSW